MSDKISFRGLVFFLFVSILSLTNPSYAEELGHVNKMVQNANSMDLVDDLPYKKGALDKTEMLDQGVDDLRGEEPLAREETSLDEKIVQPGDLLDIIVYPQERLSAARHVDSEGYLFFPYLGKIKAAGLTLEDFETQLTAALAKDYLENPRIFVRREISSLERWREGWRDALVKPILIYGDGRASAFYPTREGVTLLEVMSRQGGFPPTADIEHVRITRTVDGKIQSLFVNAADMIGGVSEDFPLKQGDILFIPSGSDQWIHIFGEVQRPGPINTGVFRENEMTLVTVISLAGGFNRIAAPNRVRIIRVVDGKEVKIKVNAAKILKGEEKDVVLEPGDIVIVPESFW